LAWLIYTYFVYKKGKPMNTHKIWLQQLQDQYNKRISHGKLTNEEINKKLFSAESISETAKEVEKSEQIDEIAPLALGALKMAGGVAARMGAKKVMKRVVGNAAVKVATPGQSEVEESVEITEEDLLVEEIAYAMIEALEEQIGRRLSPEEIEEFVDNNYEKITEEAKNQVTAHAQEGDKNKGVGANAPEEPSSKPMPTGKVMKAKGTGPKRVGGDSY
jgi:hypothetical protein